MEKDDSVWKALADPSRRALLDLLRKNPLTTGALCEQFEVTRFGTMKHLNVLERAGLVTVRRVGRERWNYINPVPIQRIYQRWIRPFEAQAASSLLNLKKWIETKESLTMDTANLIRMGMEVTIAASREKVFQALTRDIGNWWGKPYASDDTKDILLEPKLGGLFYETIGDGEGEIWGTVTVFRKGKCLQFTGSCGMSGSVYGVITFDLEEAGSKTKLKLTHHVIGEVNEEKQQMYSGGWKDLLDVRLKNWVEAGTKSGVRK